MDSDAELAGLENKKAVLLTWKENPVTREIFLRNEEEQQRIIDLLCDVTVRDVASFFAHFEAAGHLRGLRQPKKEFEDAVEELDREIKQHQNATAN